MTLGYMFALYLTFAGAPPDVKFSIVRMETLPFDICPQAQGCTFKLSGRYIIAITSKALKSREQTHAILAHEACHVTLHPHLLEGGWYALSEAERAKQEDRAWDCTKRSIVKMERHLRRFGEKKT